METIPIVLEISYYKGRYHAHRVDKTGCVIGGGPGKGSNPAEAIGNLVISYPHTTNVTIKYKPEGFLTI